MGEFEVKLMVHVPHVAMKHNQVPVSYREVGRWSLGRVHVYMGENEMWGCGASGEGSV